jgi:predicted SnoaL-like aldol condensation-catalyzing enzyme
MGYGVSQGERTSPAATENMHFAGIARLKSRVSEVAKPDTAPVLIPRRYVAEGNFVLAVVEARTENTTTNYDLFRVENGRIVEHWDVLSAIPALDRRKNENEPF